MSVAILGIAFTMTMIIVNASIFILVPQKIANPEGRRIVRLLNGIAVTFNTVSLCLQLVFYK